MAFRAFATLISLAGVGPMTLTSLCLGSAIAGSTAFLYQHFDKDRQRTQSRWGLNVSGPQQIPSGLGASGMVMGVGAAATFLMPFAGMQIFPIPITIPLWMLTALYVGVDTYFLHANSPVGHSAHLGGSVFGFLYYFVHLRRYGGVWQMLRRGMRR